MKLLIFESEAVNLETVEFFRAGFYQNQGVRYEYVSVRFVSGQEVQIPILFSEFVKQVEKFIN